MAQALLSSSPFHLKYLVTAVASETILNATILADLTAAGATELLALWSAPRATAAAAATALQEAATGTVRCFMRDTPGLSSCSVNITVAGTAPQIVCASASAGVIVEVEYYHSIAR